MTTADNNDTSWGGEPAPIQEMSFGDMLLYRPEIATFYQEKASRLANLLSGMSPKGKRQSLEQLQQHSSILHSLVVNLLAELPEPCRLVRMVFKPNPNNRQMAFANAVGSHIRTTPLINLKKHHAGKMRATTYDRAKYWEVD